MGMTRNDVTVNNKGGATCNNNKIMKDVLQSYLMVKKDIEIQPRFEPGSSECRSDALTN